MLLSPSILWQSFVTFFWKRKLHLPKAFHYHLNCLFDINLETKVYITLQPKALDLGARDTCNTAIIEDEFWHVASHDSSV